MIESDTAWSYKKIAKPLENVFVVLVTSQIIIANKEIQKAKMLEEGIER